MNNASLPLKVDTYFSLYACFINNKGFGSSIVPFLLLIGFLVYPILTYKHLLKHKDELLSYDTRSELYLRHSTAFN